MNVNEIKFNYSQMGTEKLKRLVSEIESLREEVIPVLKNELIIRNENDAVLKIETYLENKNQKIKSIIDIDQHVNERLASGEMMESIVDDLKVKGIDLLSKAVNDSLEEERLTDEIYTMKSVGLSDSQIKEKIKVDHKIDSERIELLKSRIIIKSKNNLVVGVFSILGGVSILVIGVPAGRPRFLLYGVGATIFGITKVILGLKQKKVS